jgi:hypothetical protein
MQAGEGALAREKSAGCRWCARKQSGQEGLDRYGNYSAPFLSSHTRGHDPPPLLPLVVSGAPAREIAQPGGESRELLKKSAHPGGESSAGAAGAGRGVLLQSGPFRCRQQIPAPLLHTHIPPRLLDIADSNLGVIT